MSIYDLHPFCGLPGLHIFFLLSLKYCAYLHLFPHVCTHIFSWAFKLNLKHIWATLKRQTEVVVTGVLSHTQTHNFSLSPSIGSYSSMPVCSVQLQPFFFGIILHLGRIILAVNILLYLNVWLQSHYLKITQEMQSQTRRKDTVAI